MKDPFERWPLKENYDSTPDTLDHIKTVRARLDSVINELVVRKLMHDASKLGSPEKELFDKYTPLLKGTTYGSDEYKQFLKEMGVALDHHYAANSHHPEHYENGVNGMSLLDVIEMFCDWKAATERHADGDFGKSLIHNKTRFQMSDQLAEIFENTKRELGW